MTSRALALPCVLILFTAIGTANAQLHAFAGANSSSSVGTAATHSQQATPSSPTTVPAAVSSGYGQWSRYAPGGALLLGAPWVLSWGPYGPMPYVPPIVVIAPGGYFRAGPPLPPPVLVRGLNAAPTVGPPPIFMRQEAPQSQPKRPDPSRTNQLVTIGDRLFRSGNLIRASERYEQGMHSNPNSAAPRVRLAQVAFVRGKYAEAANRFREAEAAEPGWLINAPDIQAIYAEPGDFAAPIAKLESHLQVEPNDRDAWMVLGAQWYLSGRTRQAADVFHRLTDRQLDPTLTAFIEATTPAARR
jgi:hypothetical protein